MKTTRFFPSLILFPFLVHCGGEAIDRGGDDPAGESSTRTLIDEDGDGVPDGLDTDGDGAIDIRGVGIDEDGDGTFDGIDTDGDGLIDEYVDASGTIGDGDGNGDGDLTDPPSPRPVIDEFADADGLDLLFVVDNSVSMGDKQRLLSQAIPHFMEQLLGSEVGDDVHMGVITSSLGGHGSRLCPRGEQGWNNDDQGHLIPSLRPVEDPEELGFLSWTGGGLIEDAIAFASAQIDAVGETGCGFEATLEAWYRFLVDPQPPQEIVVDASTSRAVMATDASGNPLIDGTVLAQREAFLRPDSVVAIVLLSDENDCSAMDGGSYYNNAGFGYLTSEATFSMRAATPECDENPNDACCFSCLQRGNPPEGCEASAAVCDSNPMLAPQDDRTNVRCFDQKRRFGVDLLYPVERYISALSEHYIIDARDSVEKDNPLLTSASGGSAIYRNPDNVILAGIVGVPWQDVATEESLTSPDVMELLPASALREDNIMGPSGVLNRWDLILGEPGRAQSENACEDGTIDGCGEAPVPPHDPFMLESVAPRTAGLTNPLTGDQIVDFNSTSPIANGINGHEVNNGVIGPQYPDGGGANDDLQLACIFALENPKADCTLGDLGCDCADEPLRNRALCQSPSGGAAGTTQYYGKVYPAPRILKVLKGSGDNAVVGSACPKLAVGDDVTVDSYGYNPIFSALLREIERRL